MIAKHPTAIFPIVGIGASAGGLAAFEAFFKAFAPGKDAGMAFVIVQHLAPDHKSLLSELLRRFTLMKVFEVTNDLQVGVDCVYIIPPNQEMSLLNGRLQLAAPSEPRGHRLPIDYFFRTLAQDKGEAAICIILSGTGRDGSAGLRAVKAAGGMVMVQVPSSAEYEGMPSSAIETGIVDYVLPPQDMPAQLMNYAHRIFTQPRSVGKTEPSKNEDVLKKIFDLLRAKTTHDFSQYKPSTIVRRIERRMAVHQIDALASYAKFLTQHPDEIDTLFRDLLIGVTSFFRDPEAFKELELEVISKIFDGKKPGSVIRVWTAGCSTGEEAYAIAMLLQERMSTLQTSYTVQLFATDIDSRAIAVARAGFYPDSISSDLTPERLNRFFSVVPERQGYRISKAIRDMLIFSEQNLIKDPPFSKLDLISCRNLLIYLSGALQKKVIPLFHYALNPGGRLFLGSSEGIGEFTELFSIIERKSKLYLRKPDEPAQEKDHFNVGVSVFAPRASKAMPTSTKFIPTIRPPMRDITEQALLNQFAPISALVNEHGDILYLHGRTGLYLEPAPGETSVSNILKMAREGLRRDLSVALRQAVKTRTMKSCMGVSVKTNGHYTSVNLHVFPLPETQNNDGSRQYLITLEEAKDPAIAEKTKLSTGDLNKDETHAKDDNATSKAQTDAALRISALQAELLAKDEYLQSTHEELETSNEELKSSNEEMQSINEELQSTNEELETSKEEMQSINEELGTVNSELQTKLSDLSQANNDMNNLLAGTGIATVFVDQKLRLLRFTPAATNLINLIPSDVGRPVQHVVSNLIGYDNLAGDIQKVLDTLTSIEINVGTKDHRWYAMRILPYRTLENVVEGAVISFVEITQTILAREALRKTNELLRLAVVVRDSHDAITVQDLGGQTLAWNPGAVRMYGWNEAEALLMNVRDRTPKKAQAEAIAKDLRIAKSEILEPYTTLRSTKNGKVLKVSLTSTALFDITGNIDAIATTERLLDQAELAIAVAGAPNG
jgi:two-component system, chemotaxis family, CheB/CheR fusion protein